MWKVAFEGGDHRDQLQPELSFKMAKKFADVIAHICTVHRSGDVGTLEWTTTQAACEFNSK